MRLGYFGGSFDPPHLGHLAVAITAADSFALDRVLLVPTASQPLKPEGAIASYQDRLAMVDLLCHADPRLQASDLEAPLTPPTHNYTIDTLTRLSNAMTNVKLFVIVGADAFHELPRWRSPTELLTLADWIVVARPHNIHNGHAALTPPEESRLPPLTPLQRSRVHLLATVDHPASATVIRERLSHGQSCETLLSRDVSDYIRAHGLYSGHALK